MGLPRIRLHLADEALLRLRDGEDVDGDERTHLEQCPLCQDLLAAWRAFGEAIAAVGQEPPDAYLAASTSPQALQGMSGAKRTVEDASGNVPRFSRVKRTEPLPESWTEDLLSLLVPRQPVTELGTLRIVPLNAGPIPILRTYLVPPEQAVADAAAWSRKRHLGSGLRGIAVLWDELPVELAIRPAGAWLFLVVRLEPRFGTAHGVREASLIPTQGRPRIRALVPEPAFPGPELSRSLAASKQSWYRLAGGPGFSGSAALAWFPLPASGPADLFLHGEGTAHLRIERTNAEPARPGKN